MLAENDWEGESITRNMSGGFCLLGGIFFGRGKKAGLEKLNVILLLKDDERSLKKLPCICFFYEFEKKKTPRLLFHQMFEKTVENK